MKLFEELKRRNVFRVGAAYVVLGWLVVQVTETVAPALSLPEWVVAFVIWIGVIGLPFVIFFSWAFEITPDGVKRETEVDRTASISHVTGRKLDVALLVLVTIAIGLIGWDLMRGPEAPSTSRPGAAAAVGQADTSGLAADSIVVLPLSNMSAIADNEFFAGGVHEDILTNLSYVEGLRVVSRTTALRYLASELSLADIGRELGVRYIVEGSVRRIENHVRVTVQLIDASDDSHLWAQNYDRELVDVFATQSEVAKAISNSIQLEILPDSVGTLADMPTRSVRAYDLYTKEVSIERSEAISEESYQRRRDLLEAAVAEDPDFVEAWARLNGILDEITRTNIQNDWFGETEEERDAHLAETRSAALRAIDRAVALDPDNVETLIARGTDFVAEQESGEYQGVRKGYLERAIELEPDNAVAWYLMGWWYWNNGRPDLAEEPFRKALELDPFHAHIVIGNHQYFSNMGDEEMTAMLSERIIQIAPEFGKFEDTLSRTTSRFRLESVLTLFIETADMSLIETYAETYAREAADFVGVIGLKYSLIVEERLVRVLRNELPELAGMAVTELSEGPSSIEIREFAIANTIVLSAQRILGQHDAAERTARLVIDAYQHQEFEYAGFDLMLISAHHALGNEAQLDEWRQEFASADFELDNWGNPFTYVALAYLDNDRAVRLLLESKAEHPNWHGTDVLAMNHISARALITHPDMQAFLAEEGKWVDYLGERVPEYEKYRSK